MSAENKSFSNVASDRIFDRDTFLLPCYRKLS